jgi:microcystin degradation protein MlrC
MESACEHHPRVNRKPRIAVGGILHETNTFSPGPTTLKAFEMRSLLRGEAMLNAARGTTSAPGGAIAIAEGRATLLPTLFASAVPGGKVEDATFENLAGDLLGRLRFLTRQWPGVDGVMLFLHGAMVTASDDDADGTLLARVRESVGRDCPVVAVIDSHANVTAKMVEQADLLVGYECYPHTDTVARGGEAMTRLLGMAMTPDEPHTVKAFRKLPLLMPLLAQRTGAGSPLSPVLEMANAWRSERSIASISLVPGFPFSDVPGAGSVVLVYVWDHPRFRDHADTVADELAATWWTLRESFQVGGTPLADLPATSPGGTTVLAELADNPGAGGKGDGTHLLRHLIERGYTDAALATIVDPETVAACHEAGVGATIRIGVGGKLDVRSGEPMVADWRITHLGDGVFANEGAMATGATNRIGRTTTLQVGTISVILSERRAQSLDPSVFRAGGLAPERHRWLAVKSSVHYRAGFENLASTMIDVESPGLSPSDLGSLTYTQIPRPMFPLDAFETGPPRDTQGGGDA